MHRAFARSPDLDVGGHSLIMIRSEAPSVDDQVTPVAPDDRRANIS